MFGAIIIFFFFRFRKAATKKCMCKSEIGHHQHIYMNPHDSRSRTAAVNALQASIKLDINSLSRFFDCLSPESPIALTKRITLKKNMDGYKWTKEELEYRKREQDFRDLRPNFYPEGKIIHLKTKGGLLKVRVGKALSTGRELTTLLVRIVHAPKALRPLFSEGDIVLKLFDPMNSLENRRMTRDCTMREYSLGAAWGPEPRRALTEYARMKDEAELFANRKRIDLKFCETGIVPKKKDYPDLRWDSMKIDFFKHLGKLEARHHIAMQDSWRDERVAYNRLPAHDGTVFPKMYAKVSMKIEPADGGDMGVAPAYFFIPGCLVEYIDGPMLEDGLEGRLWQDKWLKLPRLLYNWGDTLCAHDSANVNVRLGFWPLSKYIRVVDDETYQEGLRFVLVMPAIVTFRDPRQSDERFFGTLGTLKERLVEGCITTLQQARGLPELEDGDWGDYELFDSESDSEAPFGEDHDEAGGH